MHEALRAQVVRDLFVDHEAPFARDFLDEGAVAVSHDVITALTDTTTPQGVVAVAERRAMSLTDVSGDLVVVLSDVRDPGNAGTIIRSAVAAEAAAVVFAKGSVDPFHPKSVRSTAGLLFHVGVATEVRVEDALRELRRKGFSLLGADAESTLRPDEVDLTMPVALVLGNESWGIESSARGLLDAVVGIPMPGPAESLNVGIAGSILLFEAVRQRNQARGSRA